MAYAYQRKTRDEFELIGYYDGYGWDSVVTEDSMKKIKLRLDEYLENDPRPYRIVKNRIPIDKQS